MLKLYWAADSGALAPQILLEESGADYTRIEIDLEAEQESTAEFLAVNPRGQVPALVLEDGAILTESAAIALHIADLHPQAELLPPAGSSQRARCYRWLMFAVANLYEAVLRLYYTERFTADPAAVEAIKSVARADVDRYFDLLADDLGDGPYLLGERYSIVDPYILMLMNWHEDTKALTARQPGLGTLYDAVKQRPACARIWSQHFPD